MTKEYSAHPDLASEQLQRAELEDSKSASAKHKISNIFHRRHNNTNNNSSNSNSSTAAAVGSSDERSFGVGKATTKQSCKFVTAKEKCNRNVALETAATTTPTITNRTSKLPHRTKFDNETEDYSYNNDSYDNEQQQQQYDDDASELASQCYHPGDCRNLDNVACSIAAANTKDCAAYSHPSSSSSRPSSAMEQSSIDETDHVQHRFSRSMPAESNSRAPANNSHGSNDSSSRQFERAASNDFYGNDAAAAAAATAGSLVDGCVSGLSSAFSSPCASTVCSPLSTPTRLSPQLHHSHQHCCQKASGAGSGPHHQHHHHAHTQQQHAGAPAANAKGGSCKKFDARLGPSPYRQLLPIVLCILSFATVFSILIVYMDTTEIRHQQFRLNMSRDNNFNSVAQDDPTLIAFLQEFHMRKYRYKSTTTGGAAAGGSVLGSTANSYADGLNTPGASSLSGNSPKLQQQQLQQHFNYSSVRSQADLNGELMSQFVADLLGGKMNGAIIQSLTGSLGHLLAAPWLADTLNWAGTIVEPDPRRYFTLLRENAARPALQVVHACVSPQPFPKEVTIHNEESGVRINSLFEEETSRFNSRVKCFPLYTIMRACQRLEYDLLSLGVHGHELEILHTLPFDKIKIDVISIHLQDGHKDARAYIDMISKFLAEKSYRLQKKFGLNYFYQRINSTNSSRTRKKDILLLKTP